MSPLNPLLELHRRNPFGIPMLISLGTVLGAGLMIVVMLGSQAAPGSVQTAATPAKGPRTWYEPAQPSKLLNGRVCTPGIHHEGREVSGRTFSEWHTLERAELCSECLGDRANFEGFLDAALAARRKDGNK